jgi:Sec-independent protein translocase protein TatA
MEILGVGPSEFVFIVLIAIVVLGPKNMKQAGRTIGRLLNRYVTSDTGKLVANTFNELSNLPRRLMREANLENFEKELDLKNSIAPPFEKQARTSTLKSPRRPAVKTPAPERSTPAPADETPEQSKGNEEHA